MLIELLQSVLQAGTTALGGGDDASASVEYLPQKSTHDFVCRHVASGNFSGGAIRRLIIGCADDLCLRVDKESQTGFEHICKAIAGALDQQWPLEGYDGALKRRQEQNLHFHATGMRDFLIRVDTEAGALVILLDLGSTVAGRELPWSGTDAGEAANRMTDDEGAPGPIVEPGKIKTILMDLLETDADAHLLVAGTSKRETLGNGTMLGVARFEGQPTISMSVPDDVCREQALQIGAEVEVIFSFRNYLMQFTSRLLGVSRVELGGRASLSLLNLSIPSTVSPGQRRTAERVVPETFVTGSILPCAEGGMIDESDKAVPITVKDLSATGARIAMTSNTILSKFTWGRTVRLRVSLQDPFGEIELPAVIHRLSIFSEEQDRRRAQLGIEFTPETERDKAALRQLDDFIRWQQAGRPTDRIMPRYVESP